MNEEVISYFPWPKSIPFHEAADDPNVDVAAIISAASFGKTFALINEIIRQVIRDGHGVRGTEPPYLAIIIEPTYRMVLDVAVPIWFQFFPEDLIASWSKTENKLVCTNGAVVLFRSAEKIDRIRGTRPNIIGIDEARDMNEYVFQLACSRVSFRRGKVLVVSTPQGFDFSYDLIELPSRTDPRIKCFHATARDNPLFDLATIERQRDLLGEDLYEQEVLGKRIQFSGRVYRHFDPQRHIDEVVYDPLYPLCIFVDFNVSPMSAAIAHPWSAGWQVLSEVVLMHSDTDELSQTILERYPAHRGEYWVYPDPSGQAGHSSNRGRSDHAILREYFGRSCLRTRKKAPAIRDRVAGLNRLFRLGHDNPQRTRFVVDPKCKTLIKGLQQLTWKGNIPDEQAHEGHITAALGYAENYERPFSTKGLHAVKLQAKPKRGKRRMLHGGS